MSKSGSCFCPIFYIVTYFWRPGPPGRPPAARITGNRAFLLKMTSFSPPRPDLAWVSPVAPPGWISESPGARRSISESPGARSSISGSWAGPEARFSCPGGKTVENGGVTSLAALAQGCAQIWQKSIKSKVFHRVQARMWSKSLKSMVLCRVLPECGQHRSKSLFWHFFASGSAKIIQNRAFCTR